MPASSGLSFVSGSAPGSECKNALATPALATVSYRDMSSEEHAQEHERPFNPEQDIFVFGSNEEGNHYAGAAKYAEEHCVAQPGVGAGPTGRSYAIPTMHGMSRLKEEVERFLAYAAQHPEQSFFVTRVGCGLAGYQDNGVAPLFLNAPENCLLPLGWRDLAELRQGLPQSPKIY